MLHAVQTLRSLPLLALTALALASPTANADVIVIDAAQGPGFDFADLSGLQAAQDGDLVLIRAGSYSGFFPLIDGRGFTIQAERGAQVRITSGLAIRNVTPGQSMTLRGLEFIGLGLSLSDCAGPLLFEDCTLVGSGLLAAINPLTATRCDELVFTHCDLGWSSNPQAESNTLTVNDSSLYAFGSTLSGLDEFGSIFSAIHAVDSELFFSGSLVVGGSGAPGRLGGPMGCTNGGPGATGITLLGSSSIEFIDSTLQGGAGGMAIQAACSDGSPGFAIVNLGSGLVLATAGQAVDLCIESPGRSGESIVRTLSGNPGDPAFLVFDNAPSAAQRAPYFLSRKHISEPTRLRRSE